MKRRIALFLVLVLIIGVLAGCGDKSGKNGENKTDNNAQNENLQTFRIAKTSYHEDLDSWQADNEYGEAVRKMFAEIESELNIKIEVEYYSPTEFLSTAQAAITGGDTDFADVMVQNLFSFGPMYGLDLLSDISQISTIDINSDLWSKEVLKVATFSDGVYGFGNAGFSGEDAKHMYYNKTLAADLGLENLEELVENGQWTWDKMREIAMKAIKDVNNDGQWTEVDRYGATSASYDGLVPVYLTSGVETVVKDDTGRIVYNLTGDEATKAFQKFKNTITTEDGMFYAAGLIGATQQHQFLSGNALFLFGTLSQDEEAGENVDIGILPYPKYDSASDYQAPGFHNNMIMTIPANVEDKELSGKVMTLIAEKSKDFASLLVEDTSLQFSDPDSYVKMMENYIMPNYSLDLFTIMLTSDDSISNATMRAIGGPIFSAQTAAEWVQTYASKAQAIIDDMFNSGVK